MKVTLDAAHDSQKGNPSHLQLEAVVFRSRENAEKFVDHMKKEIAILWPKQPKSEKS